MYVSTKVKRAFNFFFFTEGNAWGSILLLQICCVKVFLLHVLLHVAAVLVFSASNVFNSKARLQGISTLYIFFYVV